MNAKIISSTLACLVFGSAVATTGCGQKKSGAGIDKNNTARAVVERKGKVSQLTSQITQLENDNKRLKDQRDAAQAKAQMVRVKVLNNPEDIIKELPGLYGSNDSAFQRRRIHLTESLVDHQEGSLDAIEEFLNSSQDTEPDIAADSHRRMLDRYGITEEQYVSLQNSIKETLEVMKPALDADKERRDAERAKRREEDEKRREEGRARFEDFRPKMEAFRATLEDLPEDERGQKMREWFQEQRNNPESVARREQEEKDREARREQEKNDRETRGPTASDELRAKVEANTKVVLGAEQFEAMQNDRSLGRLISEIGGNDYRDAVGGGGREDWRSRFGGGRGGDQGRGRGGR
jgi:outer membrane murein-binding lipoprotein Lpp